MSKLKNVFEHPPMNNKNKEILDWIGAMIKLKKLDFHTILEKIEEAVKRKDIEMCKIGCYYATNIIIKSKHFKNDNERLDLIESLVAQLDSISD